ncbi:hypothetical protein MKEN_00189000 [Mycena kentingensis (nom. inval.)]|nr:hypothetical protein MKEN_00189000 [Mycena kentingensis (nom. inval.)]
MDWFRSVLFSEPNGTQNSYIQNVLVPAMNSVIGSPLTQAAVAELVGEGAIDANDVTIFTATLAALRPAFTDLMAKHKILVDDSLPLGHAANARTNPVTKTLLGMNLRPEVLDAAGPLRTFARVITILHETAHTLSPEQSFPIHDYVYSGTWAFRHLRSVGRYNADTYAEAIARIAEALERSKTPNAGPAPSPFYRAIELPSFQQPALRGSGLGGLDAALAAADFRVNRAFVRCDDFKAYIQRGDSWGEDAAEAWQRALYNLEVSLRGLSVVDAREGKGHTEASGVRVADLYAGIVRAKSLLKNLRVVLVDTDTNGWFPVLRVINGRGTSTLSVPRAALARSTTELADAIIKAAFSDPNMFQTQMLLKKDPTSKFDALSAVNAFVKDDRVLEAANAAGVLENLNAVAPTPLADDAARRKAQAALLLSVLEFAAARWSRDAVTSTALAKEAAKQYLKGINAELSVLVPEILAELDALAPLAQPLETQRNDLLSSIAVSNAICLQKVKELADGNAGWIATWNGLNKKVLEWQTKYVVKTEVKKKA